MPVVRWVAQVESPGEGVRQVALFQDGQPMRWREVISGWSQNPAFRAWFSAVLAESPFAACFWETPQLSQDKLESDCRHVEIRSRLLASRQADSSAFETYFRQGSEPVLMFPNLGGDARLVVPRPFRSARGYAHLLEFLRHVPAFQRDALWQCLATTVHEVLSERPLWISTSGTGVAWLHLRVDSAPKYYQWQPFREVAASESV